MKKISKILLFTTLLIVLVGLVSASDVTRADITGTPDETVSGDTSTVSQGNKEDTNIKENYVSEDNPTKRDESKTNTIEKTINKNTQYATKTAPVPINVTTYSELNNALTRSTSEEVTISILDDISLQGNTVLNTTIKNLTINGNQKSINGNDEYQFLAMVHGQTVIINNLTITNCYSADGGAIYNNDGTLIITNSTLQNNTATTGSGGAIYGQGWNTLTIITDSTLQNNKANRVGGAVYNYEGTLIVTNSTLQNNTASGYGGAICQYYGTSTVTNSTLQNNTAERGGAIYSEDSNLTIIKSTLNNNTQINDNSDGGGAVRSYEGNLNITDSTLNNNKAMSGGAVRIYEGNLIITGSVLNNNHAENSAGGSIYIAFSNVIITDSTLENNTSPAHGGAIYNIAGDVNVLNSSLNNNEAAWNGGAIFNIGSDKDILVNVKDSNFTENKAGSGAVIYDDNENVTNIITGNNFIRNTAGNNETLDLKGTKTVKDNTYDSTDILISRINLEIKDEKEYYSTDDDIVLNFTIELANPDNYDEDILEKIGDITLYINDKENITTKYENYTLSDLEVGEYTVYFTSCNRQSNKVTLKVIVYSEITTPQDIYEHYDGINNKILFTITNPSGENGTITITVKDQDEYKQLSSYYNIADEYNLTTESLVNALENLYDTLSDSYTINVTYTSEYASPSSTEFTLNIIRKRNTTITYNILNNTEGNVQINITVLDTIYQTPLTAANIQITGDINKDTTAGILTNNTITPGDYMITVQYPETDDYKASQTTIDFTVEIDKNQKISELEEKITNLTQQLTESNKEIEQLNNKIKTQNNTINNLTQQLNNANKEIENLNNTNNQLNKEIEQLNNKIKTQNNTINNLTQQLNNANKEIENLNSIIEELTKPPLNTTITISQIKSTVGTIVNLSARIKDQNGRNINDGKVIFKVNGITLKDEYGNVLHATLTDGVATLKYKVQGVWMKNTSYVEAVYGGNENYSSSKTRSGDVLNISKGLAKISLEKSSYTAKSGETITLRAKIVDANGDPITRGKIIFKLNGKTITDKNGKAVQVNVVNGEAVLDYTIASIYTAKTYTLTAVYGGEGYNRSQTNGKLTLNKKGVTINTDSITTTNGKTTVKATITDETGELLVKNTPLAIKINGKTILSGVNSTNGKIDVSFVTTLRPGMYELQIISGENGIYKTGRMTTVLRI